jgi:molybdopterin biosynthesis enzyme
LHADDLHDNRLRWDTSVSPTVPLSEAEGEVLVEDVTVAGATIDHDRARAAGYAVTAIDTSGAQAATPVVLDVVAEVAAGDAAVQITQLRTAVTVQAGAPIPEAMDAVVRTADTSRRDDDVAVRHTVVPGENVVAAGDIEATDTLSAGTLLTAPELALLGAAGREQVSVIGADGGGDHFK